MKTPTLDEFKTWAKAHKPDALLVCAAQAFAICERERVDKYIRPIFDSYHFTVSGKFAEHFNTHEPITKPDDLYLCDDDALTTQYFEDCDKAHREHGFTGEHGYCPALIADHDRIKAENEFLRSGCDLFGLEDIPCMPKDRQQMLKLLLGACFVKEKKAA